MTRALMVSWREHPTRYDIEALQANIRRVGLVVRVRWILIVVLVVYSIIGALLYTTRIPVPNLARLMWIPALALGMVVIYNSFYSMNYRRLGNIAVWNHLQLALDAIIVTVLVYFSGGANSWFWSMYSLFILEATFILPRSRDAWLIALGCVALLGGVEWLEFSGILPHAEIPFASPELHEDVVFVAVRFLWQVAVLAGTAWVANLLVGDFRAQLHSLRSSQTVTDPKTNLFTRGYFMRVYPNEVARAQREGRQVHMLLLDLDNFGEYNERFGIDMGDQLLKAVADAITRVVSEHGDPAAGNVIARIGGEEFAILLAQDAGQGSIGRDEAMSAAEEIRTAIGAVNVEGAGVTVSVGLATLPLEAGTAEELTDAADAALAMATETGGNRVVTATEVDAEEGERLEPEA